MAIVNVMTAGPADNPVTTPEASTDAVELVVLHAPTPPLSNVIVDPTHTADGPVIPDGSGLTVTNFDFRHPVPNV